MLRRLGVEVRGAPPPLQGARGRRGDATGAIGLGATGIARTPLVTWGDRVALLRALSGVRRWRPERLADRSAATWLDELGLAGGARELAETSVRTATYVAQVRYLHRMTVVGALPVPGVGLAGRVDVGDTGHEGVLLGGDWVGPTGTSPTPR